MNQQQLRDRTKRFAIQIVRLCRHLPNDWDVRELGRQLLRSGLWLELLPEADPTIATHAHKALLAEASELTAIFTASHRTAKANLRKRKAERKKGRAN